MLELGLQRDRVGELTRFNAADNRLVDAAVDRIGEMLGSKEFGDAFIGAIEASRAARRATPAPLARWTAAAAATDRGGANSWYSLPA